MWTEKPFFWAASSSLSKKASCASPSLLAEFEAKLFCETNFVRVGCGEIDAVGETNSTHSAYIICVQADHDQIVCKINAVKSTFNRGGHVVAKAFAPQSADVLVQPCHIFR